MNEAKKNNPKPILTICIIFIIAIICGCAWYFGFKVPHDKALEDYNLAVNNFNEVLSVALEKNKELDHAISSAQAIIDSGDIPYDETTRSSLAESITNAETSKKNLPNLLSAETEMEESTEELLALVASINQQTEELRVPFDYSSELSDLQNKQTALENSISIMKQITCPSEEFVLSRLEGIDLIIKATPVTEDHDPNGKLNKQGGYTSSIYIASTLVSSEELSDYDLIEKGTEAGGCIEVYTSVEDAESRSAYLGAFDGTMFSTGSHTVLGTMVIRTSDSLKASEQKTLEAAIIEKLLSL